MVLVGVLTGLGSGTAAAQAPAPCSLLNTGQVTAAIGATAAEGKPIANTGCSWNVGRVIVTLSLWDATRWDKMKAPFVGATKSPVSGLGDDAFFSAMGDNGRFTTLTVKKGATAYVLKVYGVDEAKQRSAEQALAVNVLANLH
jgi:hypothetical protein